MLPSLSKACPTWLCLRIIWGACKASASWTPCQPTTSVSDMSSGSPVLSWGTVSHLLCLHPHALDISDSLVTCTMPKSKCLCLSPSLSSQLIDLNPPRRWIQHQDPSSYVRAMGLLCSPVLPFLWSNPSVHTAFSIICLMKSLKKVSKQFKEGVKNS